MSITYNSGSKGTYVSSASVMYDSRRKWNLSDRIHELVPSETPFLTMLARTKKRMISDPDVKMFEHRAHWLNNITYSVSSTAGCAFSASAAGATGALNLKATNTPNSTIKKGDILQILDASDKSKYANILVTADGAGNSVSWKLITNTPGFTPAKDDKVQRIGNAFEENASKGNGYTDNLETIWASTQIFRTPFGISRTLRKTSLNGGNEWARILADKGREHKVGIERTLLFGERYSGTAGDPFAAPSNGALLGSTQPLRTSHGIINATVYGDTNIGIGGSREFNNTKATYTYYDFMDDMEEIFEFGSSSKTVLAGMSVITFFNKLAAAEGDLVLDSKEKVFGLDIYRFKTPAGELNFVWHKLLREQYANFAVVVDMANVEYLVFEDTSLRTGIETPGTDGTEAEYLSDVGLAVTLPESHAVMRFS